MTLPKLKRKIRETINCINDIRLSCSISNDDSKRKVITKLYSKFSNLVNELEKGDLPRYLRLYKLNLKTVCQRLENKIHNLSMLVSKAKRKNGRKNLFAKAILKIQIKNVCNSIKVICSSYLPLGKHTLVRLE